jgi:ATP-dependent exoDNAse (exonuclease V) beta subunit
MDHSEKAPKNSFRGLIKSQEFRDYESLYPEEEKNNTLPKLLGLPLHYYTNSQSNKIKSISNRASSFSLTTTSRLIGIITHQLLHWICDNHPSKSSEIPWNLALYELHKLGFDETMQKHAVALMQEQINRLFEDPRGLWIIAPHKKEQNEYELLVKKEENTVTRIIDRTFEDQGICWVIDFKTGKEEEHALANHQQQLNEYGSYLFHLTSLPIHCGIYYLSTNRWVSWHYERIEIR